MSYKVGDIEDKSQSAAVPREVLQLQALTEELRSATALRAKDRAASLIEQIASSWPLVNRLQLATSAQGGHLPGHMAILEMCADALNDAHASVARGRAMLSDPGYGR